MRCAPFGPMPGSMPSSSMRFWTTPSYTSGPDRGTGVLITRRRAEAGHAGDSGYRRQAGNPAGRSRVAESLAEAGGERAHLLPLQLARGAVGIPAGGEHHVSERLRGLLKVVRIDRRRRDGQVHKLALPVDDCLHQPAACCPLDFSISKLLLRVHELTLHLLRSREKLLHVQLATRVHAVPTRSVGRARSAAAWLESPGGKGAVAIPCRSRAYGLSGPAGLRNRAGAPGRWRAAGDAAKPHGTGAAREARS